MIETKKVAKFPLFFQLFLILLACKIPFSLSWVLVLSPLWFCAVLLMIINLFGDVHIVFVKRGKWAISGEVADKPTNGIQ